MEDGIILFWQSLGNLGSTEKGDGVCVRHSDGIEMNK